MNEENPQEVSNVTGVGMKDFHCEMFELFFQFTPEEISETAFLEAFGIADRDEAADEDGDVFITRTFGRREKTSDYHGHLSALFKKGGKSSITLRYHESGVDIEDEKPPHIEDCAQWLAGFFRNEEIETRINAAFTFDKSFEPTIALPFPLATSEKALLGSSVTGVSIQFPKKGQLDLAIVQRTGDEIFVSIFATSNIRLRDFDLFAELKKLSVSTNSLVKKQEPSEEAESAQQEE